MDKPKMSIIILDANAFISMPNLNQLGLTNRLVTTSDVIAELRDEKTRSFLNKTTCQIEELHAEDKSIKLIREFSKKTGDVGALSDVDLELLALVHSLYVSNSLGDQLRKQPLPLVQKDDFQDIESESQSDEYSSEEETTIKENQTNNQSLVGNKTEQNDEGWISVPAAKKQKEVSSESEGDDQEAWITPVNYSKKMAEISSNFKEEDDVKEKEQCFTISLVSADFAIQNVATQMGMRLLSLDGRKITSIRRFIWECYLCWKQFKITDNKIKICTNCGYNSLSKIAYSVNLHGEVILHRKKGWKPNEKVMEWKEKKLEDQEKKKKHQHARRRKKPSIFEN